MRSKKAALNIVSSLLLQFITLICGFIIPKLIIESFGSSVNGLISSIGQFLGYITLLESGVGPVVRAALYSPIAKKDKKNIENILKASEKFFKGIALILIIYVVILSFIYPVIVNSDFNYIYTVSLIIIIAISTFGEYFFGITYKIYLQAEQKIFIVSIIQIIGCILNTIAIVVLIKLGFSVHIVKLASALIFISRPIIQNIYVKKKYNINYKNADKKYKLEQKWDGLSQHIAKVIHDNADVTILTIFANVVEVSVYSIYFLVVRGIRAIIESISNGITPSFGDMIAKNEKEKLNKNFNVFEVCYYTLITIIYTCTIVLIVPFVKVYTAGITDANYIRPIFAFLLVCGELVWSIRLPYANVTQAAGCFRETRKGAWAEALINLSISVILVIKYGLVGVAVGTLIAIIVRTIEILLYSSKYILERKMLKSFKKIFITIIEITIVLLLLNAIPHIAVDSYITWIIQAIIVFIISSIVVILINSFIYIKEFKLMIEMIKNVFTSKKTN